MKKIPFLLTLSILLIANSDAAIYISGAIGNGNFEQVAPGTPDGKFNISTGGSIGWTNWLEYDSLDNDTGVGDSITVNPGAGPPPDRSAYLQRDGDPGVGTNNGAGGAIRSTITSSSADGSAAGTVFTYGFSTNLADRGTATMVLLYNNGDGWREIAGSFLRGGLDTAAFSPISSFSRSFTVTAGSAWENQAITVGFRNALSTDDTGVLGDAVNGNENYPDIDDVVFSSVPEPSSLGLFGLSFVGLLARRRRI